jgi:DNA-binding transcriptional ArsR family regulator
VATAVGEKEGREREDAVSYALGARIRIEILRTLNEAPASAKELAQQIALPLSKVSHHIEELLVDGSIEIAYSEPRGNIQQKFYRAVKKPSYSMEEFAALPAKERQEILALIVQASTAEALASLWDEKMHDDPYLMLVWDWLLLDEQGRREASEEQERSLARLNEIHAEATNRRAKTGEPGTSYIVASFGFERSRGRAKEIQFDKNESVRGIPFEK